MTICDSLLRAVHIRMDTGWLAKSAEAGEKGGAAAVGPMWTSVVAKIYTCHKVYRHEVSSAVRVTKGEMIL